jgi:hypothetical protein
MRSRQDATNTARPPRFLRMQSEILQEVPEEGGGPPLLSEKSQGSNGADLGESHDVESKAGRETGGKRRLERCRPRRRA